MVEITSPKDFKHLVHIDRNFNWTFDESLDTSTIFKKVRAIGQGGFGSVCEMLHIPSNTKLAGKIISPDAMNRATKEALKKEIDLLRTILTPYTVRYYGSITFENSLMILMEFCDHGSLRDVIDFRNLVLDENQISIIMHDVLLSLTFLHDKYHILHRDIKAANILINSNCDVRVTDFGVSRKFDIEKTLATTSIIGTPYWMAPEVINGKKYSFPADIWSLGFTAVELAEGAPPYCEFPPTRAMIEIVTRGFPGFRNGAKFSQEFVDFVKQCTQLSPQQRPTATELLKHPFITRSNQLDRKLILKSLVSEPIDFQKVMSMGDEEEYEEEDENQTRKTQKKSKKYSTFETKASPDQEITDLYSDKVEIVEPVVPAAPKESTPKPSISNDLVNQIKEYSKNNQAIVMGGAGFVILVILIKFGMKGLIMFALILCSAFYYFNRNK